MPVRYLFRQPIICCPVPPLRLLPVFPVANSLLPIHRRSYADITRNPRDKDILKICNQVRFIDAENKFQGIQPLRYVLDSFDKEIYHLICVNPHVTEEPPTCKLISKEQLEEDEKAAYLARKAKKGSNKDPSKVVKTIEISWATAPNDLGHKIRRMTEFLQKGNRVEIILGVRKGMAKQPLRKMEELVNQVRAQAEQSGREWKVAEGMIGLQYLIYFEGMRPKVGAKPTREAKPMEQVKPTEEVEPTGEVNPTEEVKPTEEAKVVE